MQGIFWPRRRLAVGSLAGISIREDDVGGAQQNDSKELPDQHRQVRPESGERVIRPVRAAAGGGRVDQRTTKRRKDEKTKQIKSWRFNTVDVTSKACRVYLGKLARNQASGLPVL
jgi:hypothetical protein